MIDTRTTSTATITLAAFREVQHAYARALAEAATSDPTPANRAALEIHRRVFLTAAGAAGLLAG